MKKLILYSMILSLLFAFTTCNTATGGPEDGPAIDIDMPYGDEDGQLFVITGTNTQYPGCEITLQGDIKDISKYSSVTVEATLYSDVEGTTQATAPEEEENQNLAQFKLLKVPGGSNWATATNNVFANNAVKYSMEINGETTMIVPPGSSGKPTTLLIQANYEDHEDAVKSIRVRKVSFVAKVSDVVLDHIFGTSVTIENDRIIFNNSSYSNNADGNNWDGTAGVGGSAICIFPEDWWGGAAKAEQSLKDKTITFNFTVVPHTCSVGTATGVTPEHQIHIQAAKNTPEKDLFNGLKGTDAGGSDPGQKYITLDDANSTGYDDTGTGSFSIAANDLISASQVANNKYSGDGKGPFILDSVRIVNNGTKWEENQNTIHYRCKSYTLIINSVTIE